MSCCFVLLLIFQVRYFISEKPARPLNFPIHSRALLASVLSELAAFCRHHSLLVFPHSVSLAFTLTLFPSVSRLVTILDIVATPVLKATVMLQDYNYLTYSYSAHNKCRCTNQSTNKQTQKMSGPASRAHHAHLAGNI